MKIVSISQEEILFDNKMAITQQHEQDCCEAVYADFEQLNDTSIKNETFNNGVNVVEHQLGFVIYSDSGNSYYVPCYNIQNGYYSDNLSITFPSKSKGNNKKWNYQTINIKNKNEGEDY